MKIFFLSVFVLSLALTACGQNNHRPTKLIDEVREQLEKGKSVSDILTLEKYARIHHETNFRELIKEYAGTSILKIAMADEPGRKIKVNGTIQDETGKPVAGALVYLYQTDAKGWYASGSPHVGGNEGDMGHARIFGYAKTDANGKFELHTIKPSGYPQSDLPAHIHVHVWAEGYRHFINEFLFDDDDRLVGDIRAQSVRNNFMIAKPEKAKSPFEQAFSYLIELKK